MTLAELQALVEILNRTPTTTAERLWLQALIARLAAEIAARSAPPEVPDAPPA